jgi:hypothetical protein
MILTILLATAVLAADLDRDTLDDKLEEKLLKQFRPTLLIDAADCDGRPAEFLKGAKPTPGQRNGTIYGHAFPHPRGIELHYYHLWTNDCGRGAHSLDAEYVAALLEQHGKTWHAIAWIANGHDGTLCDRRHGAPAAALNATHEGPAIWVSHGKHASFLSQQQCGGGCGGDRCDRPVTLPHGKLINLGEADAPMPGYEWIRTPTGVFHIAAKMTTEFASADLVALYSGGGKLISLSPIPRPAQAAVLGGNAAVDGMATGGRHTESALATASEHVDRAVATSYEKVKGSLQRARRWWKSK